MTQSGSQPTSKNEMATKSVAKWHANKIYMNKILADAFIAKEIKSPPKKEPALGDTPLRDHPDLR